MLEDIDSLCLSVCIRTDEIISVNEPTIQNIRKKEGNNDKHKALVPAGLGASINP